MANHGPSDSMRRLLLDAKQISWRSVASYDSPSVPLLSSGSLGGDGDAPKDEGETEKGGGAGALLSEFQLKVERAHIPRVGSSFFAETVIRRSGNSYTMYLQTAKTAHPLYVGERHGSTYVFRSVLWKGEHPTAVLAGSVCKKGPSGKSVGGNDDGGGASHTVTYAITHHGMANSTTKVAYIDYEVPTVFQALAAGTAGVPRRCQVKIFGRTYVETREPSSLGKDRGGARSLDFQGRGREPSCKNMQLVDNGGSGDVVLQMAKWEDDQFNVDFSYPFDAFHAFGFALAQFDF